MSLIPALIQFYLYYGSLEYKVLYFNETYFAIIDQLKQKSHAKE